MKRRLYLPLLIMALASLISGVLPWGQPSIVYAAPEPVIIRPNAVGDETALTIGGTSPAATNRESVDEDTSDDDVTYVYDSSGAYVFDLYNLEDTALSGTINSVTVYVNVKGTKAGSTGAQTRIKTNGVAYVGAEIAVTTNYAPSSTVYNTNPQTNAAWTWTEVNALQAGVGLKKPTGGAETRCTQVWVVVDYTPPSPAPTVSSTIPTKGTTADTTLSVTINGANFVSGGGLAAEINFDTANPIAGTSVSWVSSSQITATFNLSGVTTNLGSAWDVKVTNPDAQTGTGNDLFTIYRPDPTVSSITPSTGANSGSVNITNLAGTNFADGATAVKLARGGESDINGTSVVVVSATQITCTFDLTSVAVGDWDVVVTVTGAETPTATLTNGFTVVVPPDISNTPDNYPFGVVSEGASYKTGLTYFTVTNNSGYAVNITISGSDMAGGDTWTLSEDASQGANIYGLRAGREGEVEGDDYLTIVPKSSANTLVSGLASLGTQRWGLQLLAPTSFSDGALKTGIVTLTATAA